MKIIINYDSSWHNSFLSGSNNEPLPKNGRDYIASGKALSSQHNFIERPITHDTIMGILNRVCGEVAKLYQLREDPNYYFKDIEDTVTFDVDVSCINDEIVFLRNNNGSIAGPSGMIDGSSPIFQCTELWGIFNLSLLELIDFIHDSTYKIVCNDSFDPVTLDSMLTDIQGLKKVSVTPDILSALSILQELFNEIVYNTSNDKISPRELYFSAFYLQVKRLGLLESNLDWFSKSNQIPGISARNYTSKDFMYNYSTGPKALVMGNPYIRSEFVKGLGKITRTLTKSSGKIIVNIDITPEKALDLKERIENAAVSTFYVGKKGIAFIEKITL